MPDIYPDKLPDIKLLSLANELLFSIHESSFFAVLKGVLGSKNCKRRCPDSYPDKVPDNRLD